jgi:hypothetical protein
MLSELGTLAQRRLRAVAEKWAARMSAPEHTHSVSGEKLNDEWTSSDAMELLRPIVALAKKASGGEWMYLLIEA